MDSFFFRVEHDLLRSDAFRGLGGSAIKVYLTIGLYSDFGTGWAYPSIRTIAKQAGLSRQTVLDAVEELTRAGLLAASKSKGRSTAYKIIRQAPERPGNRKRDQRNPPPRPAGLESLEESLSSVPDFLGAEGKTGPKTFNLMAELVGQQGPGPGPKREPSNEDLNSASIPIPGTPFRLTADGRLLVAVDVRELLMKQGLPPQLAEKIAGQRAPEDVAKVLLNAIYLESQGKLQNGPGYIRAGIEDGYDLLPQVANRLELRRKELESQLKTLAHREDERRREAEREQEEAAIDLLIRSLRPNDLQALVDQAVAALPEPIVRRNRTLSNPFVRSKVYELAGGSPAE